MKKVVLALLFATLLAGGAFAQVQLSAGAGGDFGVTFVNIKGLDAEFQPKPAIGFGGFAFFDASYVMAKVGVYISTTKDEQDYVVAKYTTEETNTSLSIGILGKYPIELGSVTLFPLLGIEYDMFLSGKYKREISYPGHSEYNVSTEANVSRGDLADLAKDSDVFLLQLGFGADFNLTDTIYLRPIVLWGLKLNKAEGEGDVFAHRFNINLAVGFKF